MKYIRRKPYSFVHFGACSAGKWSMSMIHPITVSNFAVSIVRNCTGNIRKREKGIRQFQCHACGKNVIVTDPLDRRRFYCSETCREAQHRAKRKVIREQKKKDKCLGIRLIFTNLSYSLNSLKERVYHESYLQSHLE